MLPPRPVVTTTGAMGLSNRILTILKNRFLPPRPPTRPRPSPPQKATPAIAAAVPISRCQSGRAPGIHPSPGPEVRKSHTGKPPKKKKNRKKSHAYSSARNAPIPARCNSTKGKSGCIAHPTMPVRTTAPCNTACNTACNNQMLRWADEPRPKSLRITWNASVFTPRYHHHTPCRC